MWQRRWQRLVTWHLPLPATLVSLFHCHYSTLHGCFCRFLHLEMVICFVERHASPRQTITTLAPWQVEWCPRMLCWATFPADPAA